MTYVKLIAKPNTWFKAFTEVYHYNDMPNRRLTISEWNQALIDGSVYVRGLRINENPLSEGGGAIGDLYQDGEYCSSDEFFVVCHTDDPTPNACTHPIDDYVIKPYGDFPLHSTFCGVCGEQLMIGSLISR